MKVDKAVNTVKKKNAAKKSSINKSYDKRDHVTQKCGKAEQSSKTSLHDIKGEDTCECGRSISSSKENMLMKIFSLKKRLDYFESKFENVSQNNAQIEETRVETLYPIFPKIPNCFSPQEKQNNNLTSRTLSIPHSIQNDLPNSEKYERDKVKLGLIELRAITENLNFKISNMIQDVSKAKSKEKIKVRNVFTQKCSKTKNDGQYSDVTQAVQHLGRKIDSLMTYLSNNLEVNKCNIPKNSQFPESIHMGRTVTSFQLKDTGTSTSVKYDSENEFLERQSMPNAFEKDFHCKCSWCNCPRQQIDVNERNIRTTPHIVSTSTQTTVSCFKRSSTFSDQHDLYMKEVCPTTGMREKPCSAENSSLKGRVVPSTAERDRNSAEIISLAEVKKLLKLNESPSTKDKRESWLSPTSEFNSSAGVRNTSFTTEDLPLKGKFVSIPENRETSNRRNSLSHNENPISRGRFMPSTVDGNNPASNPRKVPSPNEILSMKTLSIAETVNNSMVGVKNMPFALDDITLQSDDKHCDCCKAYYCNCATGSFPKPDAAQIPHPPVEWMRSDKRQGWIQHVIILNEPTTTKADVASYYSYPSEVGGINLNVTQNEEPKTQQRHATKSEKTGTDKKGKKSWFRNRDCFKKKKKKSQDSNATSVAK